MHCSCLQTLEKRASDLVIDACEPPCGCWDLNFRPLVFFPNYSSEIRRDRARSVWYGRRLLIILIFILFYFILFYFYFIFWFFETGFLCVALAVVFSRILIFIFVFLKF